MTVTEIENIIAHLERQRAAIDKAVDALRGVSGSLEPETKRSQMPGGKKSGTSTEGRQRQIESMRRYWAAKKAASTKSAPKKATKKGGLTAAGRKALSETMKKRWAEKRAAG